MQASCNDLDMKTYKFKLYRAKRNYKLHRQVNAAALAWNHCLALTKRYYRMFGKGLSEYTLKKHLTKLKKRKTYTYLCEMDAQALQDVVERLFKSYKRFFEAKKKGERYGFPKFKKVRKYKSFTLKQASWKVLDGNELIIRGQKYKYHKSRDIEGKIKTVTVKRDAVGDFWICFAVEEVNQTKVLPRLGRTVGLDFGLKTFLTLSDGQTIESPEFFKENRKLIRKANRALSRKEEDSNNRWRAQQDLARLHRRIANQRNAWHWQTAHRLVGSFAFIGMETVNLKAMQRLWGRKISDYGFSDFVRCLEHEARKVGTQVVKIDKWYPSSQLCSACGYRFQGTKDLKVRSWFCPQCGAIHDRDLNASINILTEALREYEKQTTGGASSVSERRSKTVG